MKRMLIAQRQLGFTLIELLVAMGIFLLITGAAFALLSSSQQRYQTESQVLASFQEARLGLDQMVRDINDSGYPPPTFFSATSPLMSASSPFAWSPGYPTTPCQIVIGAGGNCTTASGDTSPGDFDLIIETNPNPQDPTCVPNCVQWIRYQLQGTILMRAMIPKAIAADPDATTSGAGVLVPFVQNVVNNASAAQIAQYQITYPNMFPTGPVPIFSYTCDTPTVPQYPAPLCASAGVDNSPANIRDVTITLIVATPLPDATTGVPRLVQLSGRGRRVNPNH